LPIYCNLKNGDINDMISNIDKKILELDKGIYKKHSEKNKIIPSAYVLIIKSPQFIN